MMIMIDDDGDDDDDDEEDDDDDDGDNDDDDIIVMFFFTISLMPPKYSPRDHKAEAKKRPASNTKIEYHSVRKCKDRLVFILVLKGVLYFAIERHKIIHVQPQTLYLRACTVALSPGMPCRNQRTARGGAFPILAPAGDNGRVGREQEQQ